MIKVENSELKGVQDVLTYPRVVVRVVSNLSWTNLPTKLLLPTPISYSTAKRVRFKRRRSLLHLPLEDIS